MTLERPPHYARVRALLGALDAPFIQLWGWPGTGKRAILEGLLDDEPEAEHLPVAWLASPTSLEERLRRRIGRRRALLLTEDGGDPAGLALAASLLRPGQRLLVAGEQRLDLGRGSLATPPEALLLRPDEIDALWRGTAGRALATAEREWLQQRSGGWYLPLALWARDPATANGPFESDERFTSGTIVALVRERLLAGLTAAEEEILEDLASRDGARWDDFVGTGDEGRRESTLRALIDRLGLPVVDAERLRLPRPLADVLVADTRRRAEAGRDSIEDAGQGHQGRSRGGAAEDVRIELLGMPRAERRDPTGRMVPVTWSFKRPLRILAYLASAPDFQASREEIVSILWPEASEEAIRRNLHPAMSWLRRSVWPGSGPGGVVLLRDGVYSLDPSLRWSVDVRSFLERIDEGGSHLSRGRAQEAEASWKAAWQLYHGPFLQGWTDRWVQAQRDELQLRFTDLLRRLGDLQAALGHLSEAEDAYRTLLIEDPLEEGVHASIMRIYAARGRRDLVNRQFQRLRQVLIQELGVEPSPPTLEVFNELMIEARQRRPYR